MDLDVLLPFHRIDTFFNQAIDSLSNSVGVKANFILIDDRLDQQENIERLTNKLGSFQIIETSGGLGYGKALEIGSKFVKSNAVALFNSDDLVHPHRFRDQLIQLENSDISITRMQRIGASSQNIPSLAGEITSKKYDPIYLSLGSYGANASWCMRTEWWEENSFFDRLQCLDWRIALTSFGSSRISYLSKPLYFYRKHKNQVTTNIKISQIAMKPVFDSWIEFIGHRGISDVDYATFSALAIPWNNNSNINIQELNVTGKKICEYASGIDPEIALDISNLLKRRYLFALKSNINNKDKIKLIRSGASEITSIIGDFAKQFRR
jgi:hypothetical protein